jgi:hypothetical protein
MHKAMDLIRIELSNVLEIMEENVSWEKKITAMDTFTTMYSAILETNFEADTVMFSMLTVSIQTSKLLKEVQKQVGTMQTTIERDDDKWSTLCDITDEAVFWDSCKNLVPKNLITNFISLQKYANWKFNKPCVEYKTPSTVRFNNESIHELDDWATANVRNTVTGTYSCKAWRAPGAENRD